MQSSNRFYREFELSGTVEECVETLKEKYIHSGFFWLNPFAVRGYYGLKNRKNRFTLFPLTPPIRIPHPRARIFRVVGTFDSLDAAPSARLKIDPPVWYIFLVLFVVNGVAIAFSSLSSSDAPLIPFLIIELFFIFYLVWDLRNAILLMDEVEDLIGKREAWWRTED